MRKAWTMVCIAGLLLAITGGARGAVGVSVPDATAMDGCVTPFADRPGTGPSCETANGMLKLVHPDGSEVYTHGPDPAPMGLDALRSIEPRFGLPPVEIPMAAICQNTGYRNELIYSVPFDKQDRFNKKKASAIAVFNAADTFLNSEAVFKGSTAHYRVKCVSGAATIAKAILPTPAASDDFYTVTANLATLGFNDPLVKYWVFHDDFVSGVGGQANMCYDGVKGSDDPIVPNCHNNGPFWGVNFGYWTSGTDSTRISMHESGHNNGAVQVTAPNSDGFVHCKEELSVMCYDTGGGTYTNCVDREYFDCNFDDYFHPNPPVGNYLKTHWNTANCGNYSWGVGFCTGAGATPSVDPGPVKTCTGGLTCTWTDSTAADSSGDLQGFKWDFSFCLDTGGGPIACPQFLNNSGSGSVSGSSTSVPGPQFTVPVGMGSAQLSVTVNDEQAHYAWAYKSVTISGSVPSANPGPDQSCPHSVPCMPIGATASDPDGDLASYTWAWHPQFTCFDLNWTAMTCPTLSNTTGPLSGGSASVPGPTFTPPSDMRNGRLILTVTDAVGNSNPDPNGDWAQINIV
jgi:hypothetical protein